MAERDKNLDKASRKALKLLSKGELTVGEIVEKLTRELGLEDYEAARLVYKLREEGKIVILDPKPPTNFLGYLLSTRPAWFWLLTLAIALTNTSIYILPQQPPFRYIRYILGSVFVLYLPGAALIELLYPKRGDLSQLERFALSIGLSLALVPLVGLVLNYTPWGIRLNPIVASLTLLTLTLALGAVYRKYTYHILVNRPSKA